MYTGWMDEQMELMEDNPYEQEDEQMDDDYERGIND